MQDLYCIAVMSSIFEFLCTPSFLVTSLVAAVILGVLGAYVISRRRHVTSTAAGGSDNEAVVPQSVNYHFTRQCNYKCGFCFHTAKTSYLLEIEDAKRGLKLLKDAGDDAVVCWSLDGVQPPPHPPPTFFRATVGIAQTDEAEIGAGD